MLISAIFSVLVITVANGLKNCEDCTNLSKCTQAMEQVMNNYDEKVMKMLAEAQCEGNPEDDFRVCCSDFDEIENHPNIHLLSDECGVYGENRIIGGQYALLYEFPWIVLLSEKRYNISKLICGGSLINTRYVLTAAHCIRDYDIDSVRVGEYDINTDVDCYGNPKWGKCESRIQDIGVSHQIVHHDYRVKPEIINDIGLLRLLKPVDFSARNAGAICLPVFQKLRDQSLSGNLGTVAGWGKTESGDISNILRKVEIPIHPTEICKNALKSYAKSGSRRKQFKNTICAGEGGADSCKGDSGGPLMIENEYKESYRMIQYGIVSYGLSCGEPIPAIYTDVRSFMKWILDTIKP